MRGFDLDPRRAGRGRRRVVAGGTLGLAGAAAAVVALSGTGATSPAVAATQHHGRSVVVRMHQGESLNEAWNQLAHRGVHEQFTINMKPGRATVHRPIACMVAPHAHPKGPRISLVVGNGNTEQIPQNSGPTSGKAVHLASCAYFQTGYSPGNTGAR